MKPDSYFASALHRPSLSHNCTPLLCVLCLNWRVLRALCFQKVMALSVFFLCLHFWNTSEHFRIKVFFPSIFSRYHCLFSVFLIFFYLGTFKGIPVLCIVCLSLCAKEKKETRRATVACAPHPYSRKGGFVFLLLLFTKIKEAEETEKQPKKASKAKKASFHVYDLFTNFGGPSTNPPTKKKVFTKGIDHLSSPKCQSILFNEQYKNEKYFPKIMNWFLPKTMNGLEDMSPPTLYYGTCCMW